MNGDKPKGDIIQMPKRTKDASALYTKDPKRFRRNLRLVTDKAKPVEPESVDHTDAGADDVGDMGLARRFAEQHRGEVRYCPALGWLVWDGRRWERQGREIAKVMRYAKQTVRTLRDEVLAETDSDKSEKLFKFYVSSTRRQRLDAMIALAKDELLVEADQLDRDPFVLNCLNCTVDIRTGKRRDHNPDDLITKLSPVPYDPQAKAPRFLKSLDQIFQRRRDLIGYFQRATGYSATADVREQAMFIPYGSGSNGKDLLFKLFLEILGDYGQPAGAELIIRNKYDNVPRASIVALRGMRFVLVSETREGDHLNAALVKWLTGSGKLTSRYLFNEEFSFLPTHKIWLQTNSKPVITDTGHAIWRRPKPIPFKVLFRKPGELINSEPGQRVLPADTALGDRLRRDELPGILAWIVRGAVAWFNRGKPTLREPNSVRTEIEAYRTEEDVFGQFINEHCDRGKNKSVIFDIFVERLNDWFKARGQHTWSAIKISKRIGPAGFQHSGKGKKLHVIDGLQLKLTPQEELRQAAAAKKAKAAAKAAAKNKAGKATVPDTAGRDDSVPKIPGGRSNS